jgi:hypothetical protein
MARYAVTAAGAILGGVIGFLVGGPAGAATGVKLGLTLGGIAGSLLFPEKSKTPVNIGPRVDDLRVQTSTYGVSIPRVWGTSRISGNVIWATDIQEITNIEKVKQGKQKSFNVTYTYLGNFAVLICAGPIAGIKRIWADGNIISTDGTFQDMSTFHGTEDQPVSSTIETKQGVGTTPAYRGYAYVVFSGMPLKEYGNRIPQLAFEVYTETGGFEKNVFVGTSVVANVLYPTFFIGASAYADSIEYMHFRQLRLTRADTGVTTVIPETFLGSSTPTGAIPYSGLLQMGVVLNGGYVAAMLEGLLVTYRLVLYKIETDQSLTMAGYLQADGVGGLIGSAPYANCILRHGGLQRSIDPIWGFDNLSGKPVFVKYNKFKELLGAAGGSMAIAEHVFNSSWDGFFGAMQPYVEGEGSQIGFILPVANGLTDSSTGLPLYDDYFVFYVPAALSGGGGCAAIAGAGLTGGGWLAVACNSDGSTVLNWSSKFSAPYGDVGTVDYDPSFGQVSTINGAISFAIKKHTLVSGGDTTLDLFSTRVYTWDPETSTAMASATYTDAAAFTHDSFGPGGTTGFVYLDGGTFLDFGGQVWFGGANYLNIAATNYPAFAGGDRPNTVFQLGAPAAPGLVDLAFIVGDICQKSKMEEGSYDTAGIAGQPVRGYVASREGTGRSLIEPLQELYMFDGVDRGGVLSFQYRNQTAVGTVPERDLAAAGDGNSAEGPKVTETRTQDIELPVQINLKFPNVTLNYETGGQSAARWAVTQHSQTPITLEENVVFTDEEAKDLVERYLYMQWSMRTAVEFTLPLKYIQYDAGDVLNVQYNGIQQAIYITNMDVGSDGLISMKGVTNDELSFLLSGNGTGGVETPPDVTPTTDAPVESEYIDGPLLSDSDDSDFGFYIALHNAPEPAGISYAPFTGAFTLMSVDNTTFDTSQSVSVESIIGTTTTVLGSNAGRWNTRDMTSTVRVAIRDDETLTSVSSLQLFNGSNRAMIGDELIGWMTSTLISPGLYELSGLLRGLQGTEWAMADHTTGERFVVVTEATTVGFYPDEADIGNLRYFKDVAIDQEIDDVFSHTFTPQSLKFKPISPAHLGGTRSGGSDLTLSWVPRVRKGRQWRDLVETTVVDESSENYRIEIYNGASVVRTVNQSGRSLVYTSAQQTSDFGSPQASITVKVYQISSRVGPGYPATATV